MFVDARVGREQAGSVGEQHEQIGPDEVRHEGGDAVVVADADLVVGDGIVLVDDRHHAQLAEATQGCAGLEIGRTSVEVVGDEQHLAGHDVVFGEALVPRRHEVGLAHRRHGLQRPGILGPLTGGEPERGKPGSDRARGHHDHLVTGLAGPDDVAGNLRDGRAIDAAVDVGDRRRADLDHHDHDGPRLPNPCAAVIASGLGPPPRRRS